MLYPTKHHLISTPTIHIENVRKKKGGRDPGNEKKEDKGEVEIIWKPRPASLKASLPVLPHSLCIEKEQRLSDRKLIDQSEGRFFFGCGGAF